jgi:hypothetical protein
MRFSENQVLEVLRKLIHPASHKDLITMNMVNNLALTENKISFELEFPTFNDPLKSSIKKACTRILTWISR